MGADVGRLLGFVFVGLLVGIVGTGVSCIGLRVVIIPPFFPGPFDLFPFPFPFPLPFALLPFPFPFPFPFFPSEPFGPLPSFEFLGALLGSNDAIWRKLRSKRLCLATGR